MNWLPRGNEGTTKVLTMTMYSHLNKNIKAISSAFCKFICVPVFSVFWHFYESVLRIVAQNEPWREITVP